MSDKFFAGCLAALVVFSATSGCQSAKKSELQVQVSPVEKLKRELTRFRLPFENVVGPVLGLNGEIVD